MRAPLETAQQKWAENERHARDVQTKDAGEYFTRRANTNCNFNIRARASYRNKLRGNVARNKSEGGRCTDIIGRHDEICVMQKEAEKETFDAMKNGRRKIEG